ncbi:MAG: cell cycle transcriptional regulator TrcR [Rhizobiaceae bacterium]
MATTLLMPKATAVWLVDNTSLTFDQIADFCGLHMLEVKSIADGDSATGIKGANPMQNGQLNRDGITECEADEDKKLVLLEPKVIVPELKKKGPRYTPVSRRQDRPNAIQWLVRNHPELRDAQIIRLVGTTKNTINAIRDRTHWNSTNLQPLDPVTLGICTQIDMDFEVTKAAKYLPKVEEGAVEDGLLPASATQIIEPEADPQIAKNVSADDVFKNFASLGEGADAAEETAPNILESTEDAKSKES